MYSTTPEKKVTRARHTEENDAQLRARADELLGGYRPFHWPLEFPEVFLDNERGGFDAVVGSPLFQGGKPISGAVGTCYREYLVDSSFR